MSYLDLEIFPQLQRLTTSGRMSKASAKSLSLMRFRPIRAAFHPALREDAQ